MSPPSFRLAAVALVLGCVWPHAVAAQSDFFRSSPGALSHSHSAIDGQANCNECHDGGKETIGDKCLGCHDHADLRARIRAKKGFHSTPRVRGKACESCHLEHQGRNFNLVGWEGIGGESSFDHELAGWRLTGKHGAIDCKDCHRNRNKQGLRTYLGESKFCGGCHGNDQPHAIERRAMMDCDRCHSASSWKPAKRRMNFDHDTRDDAAMPLEGAHAEVSCGKCHPKAKFNLGNQQPDDCIHCHKSPHTDHLFGEQACGVCHSPTLRKLSKHRFEHGRRTKFELAGSHGKLRCYQCHTAALGKRKPKGACEAGNCHGKDNPHGRRFERFGRSLPACGSCHPSSSWKPSVFDHNRQTKFKLIAKHAEANCRDCHRGKRKPFDFEQFELAKLGCMGCHRHAGAHKGQFAAATPSKEVSGCLHCHETPGQVRIDQRAAVRLYHGPRSEFPLEKAHKKVTCEKCHVDTKYSDVSPQCGPACHADELHRGRLGAECSRCHKGGRWQAVRFDHSSDTDWPLKGWHQRVTDCQACHPERVFAQTPRSCGALGCHGEHDVHRGKLGSLCEQCHREDGKNLFDHNLQAEYQLRDSHLAVRCVSCHPSIEFKPRPKNCYGCHPEPKVHVGQYGTACGKCHNERDFREVLPLHDVGSFSLRGAHDQVQCVRCHGTDSRPLAGQGNLCITCHRQDDVHFNSLSPRCGECHTQWAFAPARFEHTTVGCNLTGLHRSLPCYDCHNSGNFGALSATCYACHADLALRVPNHEARPDCGNCHSPSVWYPANGQFAYRRNSICR